MSFLWQKRWQDEYELAVKRNSVTRTIVPSRKHDLSTWKGYLKARDGQLHSMEVRLKYRAKDGRTLSYPLVAPEVEWQTPIRHPNIQPPRPKGEGIVCLAPFQKPDSWNPKTHVVDLLDFIELLLYNPNPADPINHPTCLQAAIAMIRERLASSTTSSPVAGRISPMLAEAEGIIRRFSDHWNKVTTDSQRERDRAWYLVVESGKTLTAVK
ncbi:MAG: ubiquitin-conjugating enzyme E2 [Candidatus Bathyarchaeia archaeon]|jgi:ubiquitin-protein ligase